MFITAAHQYSARRAARHPRRDDEGHPSPAPQEPAQTGDPQAAPDKPEVAENEWEKLFAGLTPEKVKEALDNSRRWETRSKENRPKAEKYDALVAALTGGEADTEPDPTKLASDLTAAQQRAREVASENVVLRLAARAGANADDLLDSRAFMAKVSTLDPDADDFAAQVESEIAALLDAKPSLRATPQQVGTHVPHEGGTPNTPPDTSTQIAAAERSGDAKAALALKAQRLAELHRTQ